MPALSNGAHHVIRALPAAQSPTAPDRSRDDSGEGFPAGSVDRRDVGTDERCRLLVDGALAAVGMVLLKVGEGRR